MKKVRQSNIWITFIIVIGFAACEGNLLQPDPDVKPKLIFNYLWDDVNNRYSYFELKGINWDSVKNVFSQRIYDEMNEEELFDVMAEMLFELQDGHVNLTSTFDRSRNWEWFLNFPVNYSGDLINEYYLGKNYRITGPFLNQIIDSVLYVNYRSFSESITDDHLNKLMERAKGLKGVIIDIRNNGGGQLQNAYKLSSCFAKETYDFGKERIKTGKGKDDYSAWKTRSINPRKGSQFTGKVVVLTNRRSYSASTFFALMMQRLPNAILIGDQTGGGGGIPAFGELPNGWIYRFSATQTTDMNGEHIETGVKPDIRIDMLKADEDMGLDSIIEKALAYLK